MGTNEEAKNAPPVEALSTAPPTERHRDVEFDSQEFVDDVKLTPDFEAEETDEANEVFEDDVEEGTKPDEAVDPTPNEVTS